MPLGPTRSSLRQKAKREGQKYKGGSLNVADKLSTLRKHGYVWGVGSRLPHRVSLHRVHNVVLVGLDYASISGQLDER